MLSMTVCLFVSVVALGVTAVLDVYVVTISTLLVVALTEM
jgi:hypothetical protein